MITFSQKYLRQALGGLRVLKVWKQKISPLQCVLIRGTADTVTFEATNLDEHLRFEGRGETGAAATQLVPYEVLNDVLKSADPDTTVAINPDSVSYLASGSRLTVPLAELNHDDFPPAPIAEGKPITLPAGVIGSIVEAQGCASTDAARYILNSVLLSPREVVATDGRQLYMRNSLDLPLPKDGVILPLSGVPGVLNAEHPAELWTWHFNESPKAAITQGPWRWTTKLVNATYPNWKQVVPRDQEGTTLRIAEADATRLISVLPRLPGFREENSPVVLHITHTGANLCPPPRLPQVKVDLDRSVIVSASCIDVQFNAGFLVNALKRGFRDLLVKDEVSPLLMKDANRLQMWMPVRLDVPALPTPPAPATPPDACPERPPFNPQPETQHQPVTPMVAPNNTQTAEDSSTAPRPDTSEHTAAVAATPFTALQRAKELVRELQGVLGDAGNAVRDLEREKRATERDLDALKRNLRALKSVEV